MKRLFNRQSANILFAMIIAMIVGVLGSAILTLPTEATGLAGNVYTNLDQTGVKNPVTAVLLNYRGYDTLLELTVLFLAVLGARGLRANDNRDKAELIDLGKSPVLVEFIRVVAPVMVIIAGYLLWVGGHAPGGAFQAGAVLTSLGVLLYLGNVKWAHRLRESGERWLLIAGLTAFLTIGVGTMMTDDHHFLQYSPAAAKWLILVIETCATVSIAAILLALFLGGTLTDHALINVTKERRRK